MSETRGFFGRLKDRLVKTRSTLVEGVKQVFSMRHIDENVFDDLEALLIQADIGVETSMALVENMRNIAKERKLENAEALYDILKEELIAILEPGSHEISWSVEDSNDPHVSLIVGVNGSGKTTTIGKLASHLKQRNKSVVMGAADTFRAAAVEQLTIWSERVSVPIVKSDREGADPASVAYETVDKACKENIDNVIIDTAGRLHTKTNLMEELKKVHRVIGKRLPGAPHNTLLILDATTGQNGLTQAQKFTDALKVDGIIITKLDGTAKGGISVAIQKQLGVPIKYIGLGEAVEDLQPFVARDFVNALFD